LVEIDYQQINLKILLFIKILLRFQVALDDIETLSLLSLIN